MINAFSAIPRNRHLALTGGASRCVTVQSIYRTAIICDIFAYTNTHTNTHTHTCICNCLLDFGGNNAVYGAFVSIDATTHDSDNAIFVASVMFSRERLSRD